MGGTRTAPYTNKGLEQLKKECRETPGCVGFNYSATKKEGTFVIGTETGAIPAGAIDGIHVGKSVPIIKTVPLPTGERVSMIEDGVYTKMVSTSGVAKYYTGRSSTFDPSRWNTYTNNPGNYIALAPPQEYAYYRKTNAPEVKGVIEGNWMPGPMDISRVDYLPSGEIVYMLYHQPYTKMVSSSGAARYYAGPLSAFDPNKWGTYSDATGHYVVRLT
jgi:hypothetical protein